MTDEAASSTAAAAAVLYPCTFRDAFRLKIWSFLCCFLFFLLLHSLLFLLLAIEKGKNQYFGRWMCHTQGMMIICHRILN